MTNVMVSTLSLPVMYLILCNNKFVFLTPIRQGNIYIMHQMMQYGADLRLIDLQGKTSMHHAVTGGNMWVKGTARHNKFFFVFFGSCICLATQSQIYLILVVFPSVAVHYLWETGMFRFSDTDMYRVSPLHLAASTGNTEMVRYLLRHQVW